MGRDRQTERDRETKEGKKGEGRRGGGREKKIIQRLFNNPGTWFNRETNNNLRFPSFNIKFELFRNLDEALNTP